MWTELVWIRVGYECGGESLGSIKVLSSCVRMMSSRVCLERAI
jgi:hypothetical protein